MHREEQDDGYGEPRHNLRRRQRRAPGGTFPSPAGAGGGGGVPDIIGVEQDEVELNPELPPTHPCGDPETALEWNADAAAAAAAREFTKRAEAQDEDLNTREWGAFLYRNADGSVRVGPINSGPEFQFGGNGTVPLIEDGPRSDIVGFVHSHNSGGHLPSSGNDVEPGDIQVLDFWIGESQNASMRMYIVAPNQGPAGYEPYNQINVYNSTNAREARNTFTNGPEINPEGEPCPGS